MAVDSYHQEEDQKNFLKLQELIAGMPSFVSTFFLGIQNRMIRTRLAYAYDLNLFFQYLIEHHPAFRGKSIQSIQAEDMQAITTEDLDLFLNYVTYYRRELENTTLDRKNDEKGKARKLAALRALFKFLYKRKAISADPAGLVDAPKIHDKAIIRLEPNEVAQLLDVAESGEGLTERQKRFHERTKDRDLALLTLLAGTGMRVSECVGIDVGHLDFDQNAVLVTRKGGNQARLYFGDEVREALLQYLGTRPDAPPEEPLFLSNRGSRLTVRSVENLVKKYAAPVVGGVKNISPHKLRSTYATNLYRATGDIYLVADTLGHADVNTTRKHYADIEEDRRRRAAGYIHLRKD